MRELLKTTNVYKVNDEEEAIALIQEYKDNQLAGNYTLTKSSYVLKNKKAKGEIIDSWTVVSIEQTFSD